jgi:hypothetical protein
LVLPLLVTVIGTGAEFRKVLSPGVNLTAAVAIFPTAYLTFPLFKPGDAGTARSSHVVRRHQARRQVPTEGKERR